MKLTDILRIALSTFVHNKMRTLLTVFGIAIGIGAIVFLVSLGFGLQNITVGEIQSIKALKTFNVTRGDSEILSMDNTVVSKFQRIEGVTSVEANLSMPGQISLGSSRTDVLINAASAAYLELDGPRYEAGGGFENDSDRKIVVTSVVANAFGADPRELVNQKIKVFVYVPDPDNPKASIVQEGQYEVAGVIRDTVASYAYMPIGTLSIPEKTDYSVIKVNVKETRDMAGIKEVLVGMGYKTSSIGEKVDQMNRIFRIAQIVLLVLGAIALAVASIGMFNTLTISLLERTKDIGVMKAIGATDREIHRIFLAESAIISLAGGVGGIVSALILGGALNIMISQLAVKAGGEKLFPFQVPVNFVLIIFGFSLLVGILTGLYPSRRAARLNPLDALRYE